MRRDEVVAEKCHASTLSGHPSPWQRRTNVWRRWTSPARRAKRLRKRGIPQAGLIRWLQISRCACDQEPWSQRAMLTSNDYKELAARCAELASESSEPTVAEALRALASDYLARAAKLRFELLEPRHEAARPWALSALTNQSSRSRDRAEDGYSAL